MLLYNDNGNASHTQGSRCNWNITITCSQYLKITNTETSPVNYCTVLHLVIIIQKGWFFITIYNTVFYRSVCRCFYMK